MKVTANMLYYDTINGQEQFDKWHECMATPIVPRKMVEMIIKKCREDYACYGGSSPTGREALSILDYSIKLLERFEEDTEKGVG